MLSFTKFCRDVIRVRWKALALLYVKFIQETTCQILPESGEF